MPHNPFLPLSLKMLSTLKMLLKNYQVAIASLTTGHRPAWRVLSGEYEPGAPRGNSEIAHLYSWIYVVSALPLLDASTIK